MTATYTIQQHEPSGDTFLLAYDENDQIVACIPNVNLTGEELAELADEAERGDIPTLDQEWYDNAEWARQQEWGYPMSAQDIRGKWGI